MWRKQTYISIDRWFCLCTFAPTNVSRHVSLNHCLTKMNVKKMKARTILLTGLCALGLCTWQTQAMNVESNSITYLNMEDNVPTEYEQIILMGDLLYGAGPNAIVAGGNRDAVYLHFNQSFGNVSVKIYNDAGCLVYCSEVNTSVQQTFIIPIMGGVNGHYVLELNNANGYAEGEFVQY